MSNYNHNLSDILFFVFLSISIKHTKLDSRGVSRIFERGGPISLGSLKKVHQILKGGGPMVMGGATNLAYLDAKE